MQLQVNDKTLIAAKTLRIGLAPTADAALPVFQPGAHIELSFGGFTRRYSLTSPPEDTSRYEICVLRTHPGRGGSAYLHDQLAEGDKVAADGPFNAFPLNTQVSHSVFIAGGIGITPFFTMMHSLDVLGLTYELHYAARSADRFIPLPHYRGTIHHYPDQAQRSTLDIKAVLRGTRQDADIYVCGPSGMIAAVRDAAHTHGWPAERVHYESFGPTLKPEDRPVTVHLAMSGNPITVQPGTTILDALLENGVWAPYECRRGECGTCTTEVLSGEVDHRDVCLSPVQREGNMCTCISWARSPQLTLNL